MVNIPSNAGVIGLTFEGIGKAITDHLLQVPHYQRDYAWDEDHVKALFQDISTAINDREDVYFLGSVVTIQTEQGRLEVVDGQQRLATISILLAAIRDYFEDKGDRRAEIVEDRFLLTTSIQTLEKIQRLELNAGDNDWFLRFVLAKPAERPKESEPSKSSNRKLQRTTELAIERVQEIVKETNDPFGKLNEWIMYVTNNVKIIWFTVSSDANAFMIFETLNDRGLELTISDLLKNYLFSRADTRFREVEAYWKTTFGTFEAQEHEDLIVRYIHTHWSSRYGLTRERELYAEIKKKIVSTTEVVAFTRELAEGAKAYIALLSPDHEYWQQFEDHFAQYRVRDCVRTLLTLKLEQFRPLLLAVLRKFEEKEVARTMQALVSWTVRLLISGGGGGALEQKYPELAVRVSKGELNTADDIFSGMADIIPNDKEFETAFATVSISRAFIARYLLNAIETAVRGDADAEMVLSGNPLAVNLEHVLPDKPSPKWSHISEDDYKAYRNRLGNLTLLGSKKNSTLKDASFADKQKVYKDSGVKITQIIAEETQWSRVEIERRQGNLAKVAVKVWGYKPKILS